MDWKYLDFDLARLCVSVRASCATLFLKQSASKFVLKSEGLSGFHIALCKEAICNLLSEMIRCLQWNEGRDLWLKYKSTSRYSRSFEPQSVWHHMPHEVFLMIVLWHYAIKPWYYVYTVQICTRAGVSKQQIENKIKNILNIQTEWANQICHTGRRDTWGAKIGWLHPACRRPLPME